MADVDMKQKIKEVRDKFLSNNQIEDIRQNITLGVEERLKFLNSEQVKVVELLEEKHRELDEAIHKQSQKIDGEIEDIRQNITLEVEERLKFLNSEQVKVVELLEEKHRELDEAIHKQSQKIDEEGKIVKTDFESQMAGLKAKSEQHSNELEKQDNKLINEQINLEKRLDEKFENKLEAQQKFFTENLEKLTAEHTELKKDLDLMKNSVSEKVEEKGNQTLETVNGKLLIFEEDKKELLKRTESNFSKIESNVEEKIEDFIKNHETVESVIDSRLNEFRKAQKAAFEELEAALNLLEKHQDDSITRFRQKSDIIGSQGQTRQTNLPNSLIKNRGSILYQSQNFSDASLPIVDDVIETAETLTDKTQGGTILKPLVIAFVGSIILLSLISYFNVDIKHFINLSINFLQ